MSSFETAQPTIGDSLGSKRTGEFGVQRTPIRSNLDVAGQIGGQGDEPGGIGDFIETNQNYPKLLSVSYENTGRGNC